MKNYKRGSAAIILIIIAVVIISGGAYFYVNSNKGESTSTTETTTVNTEALTVTKEGPGNLSVKVPESIAQYLTGEGVKTFPNSTELILGISGDTYFKAKNLSPNAAEYFITIAEQKYSEDSYCGNSASYYDVISKNTVTVNGYSFTQVNERGERDSGNIITIFNKTNKNTCRYVRLATESAPEHLIRALASEDPKSDKKQIDLLVKNTKVSRDYFNALSEQIAKTISAK